MIFICAMNMQYARLFIPCVFRFSGFSHDPRTSILKTNKLFKADTCIYTTTKRCFKYETDFFFIFFLQNWYATIMASSLNVHISSHVCISVA